MEENKKLAALGVLQAAAQVAQPKPKPKPKTKPKQKPKPPQGPRRKSPMVPGGPAAAPAEPEEETPGGVEVKVEPGTEEPPPAKKTHSATAAPMMMTDIALKAKARGAPPAEGPPGDGEAGGAAAPPKKRKVLPQPLFETDITFFEQSPAPPPWE